MNEEDFYGDDLDYIHIKFGRMQKAYNFTDKLMKSHPNFCDEYIKYWNNDKNAKFKTPLQIARYVDVYDVPVRFYFNYTDTPVKDITEVYEYFIRESVLYDSGFENDKYFMRGFDGENLDDVEDKAYKVVKEEYSENS